MLTARLSGERSQFCATWKRTSFARSYTTTCSLSRTRQYPSCRGRNGAHLSASFVSSSICSHATRPPHGENAGACVSPCVPAVSARGAAEPSSGAM
jgi:hypothetical protein